MSSFELTLTFDNGPDPFVTPAVLDVLKRRGIRATFFVIGHKLEDPRARSFAERAHAEGHWLGNHSYSHSLPLGFSNQADVAEQEIGRTQFLMGKLAHPQRFFRPFGGGGNLDCRLMNATILKYLIGGRYTCVLWNAIPRDWEDPDGWVARALSQCTRQPWSLMALHDLPTGAMRHLESFIDRIGESGGRIRQDFPPACVPIIEGVQVLPMEDFVGD